MQFHPLSIYPLVYSGLFSISLFFNSFFYSFFLLVFIFCDFEGNEGIFRDETKKSRKGSNLINLDLEIGCFGKQEEEEEENILFTDSQFHELYLQVVIFKYLSFGLPVPFHLVLPIFKIFGSFLGCGFSPGEFVQRSMTMMDSESGRCRRNDGKKWRCRGNVVPDQKYCAKHMHKGSKRSRKRVEASKTVCRKSISRIISSCSLDLAVPSPTVEVDVTFISRNGNNQGSSTSIVQADESGAATNCLLGAQVDRNNTRNESSRHDSPGLGSNYFSTGKTYSRNQVNKAAGKPSVAGGFGASPKSNHQGGIGTGCMNSSFDNNKTGMLIDQRCRRTDGKSWRCARDVVPSTNYCENHLHRGAKRAMVESKSTTLAPGDSSSLQIPESCGIHNKVKNSEILNTNLSISISSSNSDSTSFNKKRPQFRGF